MVVPVVVVPMAVVVVMAVVAVMSVVVMSVVVMPGVVGVVVGTALPPRVRLYPVPPQVGLTTRYDYAVVNNRTVLVDPASRQVTYIIE